MLTIKIPDTEYYNEEISQFVSVKERTIDLEHSLVSLSKWEAKWCKPFLGKDQKTSEEVRDYIRCMIIDRNVPDNILYALSKQQEKHKCYVISRMRRAHPNGPRRTLAYFDVETLEDI